MGRGKKKQPRHLAKKLRTTRIHARLTQEEMMEFIRIDSREDRSLISYFESGKLEPSLLQLLNYAKLANLQTHHWITVDHFADDDKNLPFE